MKRLAETARRMLADDKGLLAMDESNGTCDKRFAKAGIAQTEEARRRYRELIITTPDLAECISGVIQRAPARADKWHMDEVALPSCFPHWRTVSQVTQIPRADSIFSTMRRLNGNRK